MIRSRGFIKVGDLVTRNELQDHDGWLLCYEDRTVNRVKYARLFAKIGTYHGSGDGSTTFNPPDPSGRSICYPGQGAGLTKRNIGDVFGSETHLLTSAESGMPAHRHQITAKRSNTINATPTSIGGTILATPSAAINSDIANGVDAQQAHNNMSPMICLGNLLFLVAFFRNYVKV